jgi:hypothetical protein
MAVILGQGSTAVPDGDAKAFPMSLDLYRLRDVDIEVWIHLDDIIHLRSSI